MKFPLVISAVAAALTLTACNDTTVNLGNTTTATAPGYTISTFAKSPSSTQHPDSIVQMGGNVYVGYQNAGEVKDGSVPGVTNTIVKYDLMGNVLTTYTVPGHNDGLLARSDLNQLWAMSNEDGNPELTIINFLNGTQQTYQATVNPTAHGGGYDDMQLLNGVVYVSASNPSTPGAAPTVVALTLNSNGVTFDVAPVLAGNAMATDITPSVGGSPNPTFGTPVLLTLTDPDSEAIDSSGDLVLDSQADGKLVFIKNPGASQTVSVLSLTLYNDKDGPIVPVDDTRWVPSPGATGQLFMLFTDTGGTTVFRVDAAFNKGDAYSASQGLISQLDPKTGHLTPVIAGLGSATAINDPHGILFVTN